MIILLYAIFFIVLRDPYPFGLFLNHPLNKFTMKISICFIRVVQHFAGKWVFVLFGRLALLYRFAAASQNGKRYLR